MSTEELIQELIQELMRELRKEKTEGKVGIAIFLDFKRAFETLDRNILVKKPRRIGIGGRVIEWFEDYLKNRKQRVVWRNWESDDIDVDLGVPQGSRLGTILFLIYINDIKKAIKRVGIKLFADDTLTYFWDYSVTWS